MTGFLREGWVQLPGGDERLALRAAGQAGPVVVFHHATGLCKAVWDPMLDRLAERARVFSFDARGHGDSVADPSGLSFGRFAVDLTSVLEQVRRETGEPAALVVGSSLGGIAALAAAVLRPQLQARVLALDPVVIDGSNPELRRTRRAIVAATFLRRATFRSRQEAYAQLRGLELYRTFPEDVFEAFVREGLREVVSTVGDAEGPPTHVELKCSPSTEAAIYALGSTPSLTGLAGLPVELHVWAAARGPFASACEQLAREVPAIELTRVDTGHMIAMEAPDEVLAAIQTLVGLSPADHRFGPPHV